MAGGAKALSDGLPTATQVPVNRSWPLAVSTAKSKHDRYAGTPYPPFVSR
jgi:hypothetical protein